MSNRKSLYRWIRTAFESPTSRQRRSCRGGEFARALRLEMLEDRQLLSIGPGIIQTIAGNGTSGNSGNNGPALAAEFTNAMGVAIDSAGDIFIADYTANCVREILPSGIIVAVAGTGSSGYSGDGGQATAAKLKNPEGLAVDNNGNLYIADSGNNRIRKVNLSTGIITTIAGTGSAGYSGDNGPATNAKIDDPADVAVDSAGNVYIADEDNGRIRKVNVSTGDISTVAGNGDCGYNGDGGEATKAWLQYPGGVFVDAAGDIFIADTGNNRIREVNTSGIINTVAGNGYVNPYAYKGGDGGYTGDGGQATKAELNGPNGVCVDLAGNIYIADSQNFRIRKVNTAGIITTVAGNGTPGATGNGGPATNAEIGCPNYVAVNFAGDLYLPLGTLVREVGATVSQTTSLTVDPGSGTYGSTTTLTATLTCGGVGVVTEPVVFTIDGSSVGTATTVVGGVATLSGVNLTMAAGNHTLGATFAGDAGLAASTAASVTLTVNRATPTVTVTDPGGAYDGSQVVGVALVAGVIGGVDNTPSASLEGIAPTLLYYTGTSPSGSGTSVAPSAVGTYTVVATFPGSANYAAASSSPVVFTISPQFTAPIYTFAGGGSGGLGDGGAATNATLNQPVSVAVDGSGNVYITDLLNHRIRKVTSGGIISTIAGNGTSGFTGLGGPATDAEIACPSGITVDAAGNVYFSDSQNNVIEKVDASGNLTLVAGTGTAGSAGTGGLATAADLYDPQGMAVNSDGTILYFADTYNDRICQVDLSSGILTVVAGQTFTKGYGGDGGQATDALLNLPQGVAVDQAGNLFIADTGNHRVRKVNAATQIITTVAGNGTAGSSGDYAPATAAKLTNPWGLAVDNAGHLFIGDPNSYCVREVDMATGIITTVAGNGTPGFSGDGGPSLAAQIQSNNNTLGVALDAAGNIFLVDTGNQRVREVVVNAQQATTLALNASAGTFGGSTALSATLTAGGSPVAGKAVVFVINGSRVGSAMTDSSGVATLSGVDLVGIPAGSYSGVVIATFVGDVNYSWSSTSGDLTVNKATPSVTASAAGGSYDGAVYLASAFVAGVDNTPAASLEGVALTVTYYVGASVSGSGSTSPPAAVGTYTVVASFAGSSDYVAADSSPVTFNITAVTPGQINTVAGTGDPGYSGDGGLATAAHVDQPFGIVIDSVGNIFIADIGENRVREVNHSTGVITTIAGNGTAGYSGDGGAATSAQLNNPAGLAVDNNGNLFIADFSNNRIRKVNLATGVITTVAGNGVYGYNGDNLQATAAQLGQPYGVAVDATGNLFIADYANNRIREVNPTTGLISTVAGKGIPGYSGDGHAATQAELYFPTDVALDGSGNLYIADPSNNVIRMVNMATGVITTVAGNGSGGYGGDGGAATAAVLSHPTGVTLDQFGDLFIADMMNNCIRRVTLSNGLISTVAGEGTYGYSGDGGQATAAGLAFPADVAVDPAGNLYIADYFNNAVREVGAGAQESTSLVLNVGSGLATYGGSATFTATLASGGVNVAGEPIVFTIDGAVAGSALTDVNGVATLTLSTVTTPAGGHSVGASFAGDGDYAESTAVSAGLTVGQATPTLTVTDAGGTYCGSAFAATAQVAGVIPGVDDTPASSLGGVTPTLSYYAGTFGSPAALGGQTPLSGAPATAGNYTVLASYAGSTNYTAASATTTFTIAQATPTITWATPAAITYGTALGATQLDASANVLGTFAYTPASGTVLSAGNGQTLSVLFTPTDSVDYTTATKSVLINVAKATPTITWATPAAISYGTALDATQLDATADVPGTFVYVPESGTILPVGNGQTLRAFFTPNDSTNYNSAAKSVSISVVKATPTITWATPAAITYGTPLGATQLDATADVPGTFTYTPASGTVLHAGNGQSLSVLFTPTDTDDYTSATASVSIDVAQATPAINWSNPSPINCGTPLSAAQLNATANVPGSFAYTPPAGTLLSVANGQTLSVLFTPTDTIDYTTATVSVSIDVAYATPTLTWAAPAPIAYGTPLDATQLNATANVPGTFVYTPRSGTLLPVGDGQTLTVLFTPTDNVSYSTATMSVEIDVVPATPTVAWGTPAAITYGTALDATQLNATASVPGTFVYTPAAGTVLPAGNGQTLSVTFTPSDTVDYTTVTKNVSINVAKASPTVTWATPASIVYGTPLGPTELNATANVPGTFVYTPAAGTVLPAGNGQTLSVLFTPTDTANYTTASTNVSINVHKSTPVLTWSAPASITYGTALGPTQLNATANVPGTFVYTPAAGTVLPAGNGQSLRVVFTPSDSANYVATSLTVSIDITKAPLTITADNKSMIMGDIAPPLTASYSGFVNGDSPASLVHLPILSTTATAQSPAGSYAINVSGAMSNNYAITQNPGTMLVISDVGRAVLIADPLDPNKTLLSLSGTAANDVIQVNPAATPGYVTVTYDGHLLGSFNPTSRIRIHGGGGMDTISVSQSATVAAWLYADNGNAQLQGGGGPTLLIGGSGRNTLWGGSGRTIAIGGSARTTISGGSGDAVLIGGTTAYDANAAALKSLLDAWNSSAGYSARVSDLMSDPLHPLDAETVFNNNAVDSLFGGSGMDLFFESLGDNLRNTRSGETVIIAN
jgi:sugar lactone lactonase YvrE